MLALAFGATLAQPIGPVAGPVPVLQVVDGDTVVLESNLGPRTVRLIGVDAPETVDEGDGTAALGRMAAEFVRGMLPPGTAVWVELDLETEDAYGRLLAYVYLAADEGPWRIDGEPASMVNLEIVRAGYATAMTIPPNTVYWDLFEDAEAEARSGDRGLWAGGVLGGTLSRTTPANSGDAADAPAMRKPIEIACAIYDPDTPNDADGEVVEVRLNERIDTRGYNLWDEGSGTTLPLPPGERGPGILEVHNPGQGIWNNGGDTIYLRRGREPVDAWDYSARSRTAPEGAKICRGDPP